MALVESEYLPVGVLIKFLLVNKQVGQLVKWGVGKWGIINCSTIDLFQSDHCVISQMFNKILFDLLNGKFVLGNFAIFRWHLFARQGSIITNQSLRIASVESVG